MKVSTNVAALYPYDDNFCQSIDSFFKGGFRHFDFNFYEHTDLLFEDSYWEQLREVKEHAEKIGADFVQAHAPNGNYGKDPDGRQLAAAKKCIEACGMLGIPTMVTHSAVCGSMSLDEYFTLNAPAYRELVQHAEPYGVSVLIENSAPQNMGKNRFFLYGKEMADFCREINHPLIGACWDTGHANLFTDQYQNIQDVKSYLKAVHIADNFGKSDDHIAPFQGCMNVDEVMHALLDADFKGPFNFEADNILRPKDGWPIFRKEYTGEGKPLLDNPSRELIEQSAALLYQIGKYILTAYNCFEE